MLKKYLYFIIPTLSAYLLTPSICVALLCPTNFNQFDLGDSMDQVIQQCGKPDSQNESTKKDDANIPQEWTYLVPQTVATSTAYSTQGTLKTTLIFDKDGKAMNISVNGIGVGESSICNNISIQLGDTRDKVEKACGKPVTIVKQPPPDSKPPADIKVTEFIYNTNPPLHLIFEDGKLKETK